MPFSFFTRKKAVAPPTTESLSKKLQQKDASTWTVNEVAIWLEIVGLAEYKQVFLNNQISGQELLELGPAEITEHLKITKLGHVKKLQKLISALGKNSNITNFLENLSDTSDSKDNRSVDDFKDSSSMSSAVSSQAMTSFGVGEDLVFKCYHGDDIHLISMKRSNASYSELKLKIIEEYNCAKPMIKYKDTEGDFIAIKKDSDFTICVQNAPVDSAIRLYISTAATTPTNASAALLGTSPSVSDRPKSNGLLDDYIEPEMDDGAQFLEDLVDSVVIITDDKIVRFFNKSAEKMFGYSKKEVLGQNVRLLMPNPHRANHNNYVQNFLNTGNAKIIGSGRMVEGRSKDGGVFPIWLTIAESTWLGDHAFTATIQDLRKQKSAKSSNNSVTALLDTLIDAMVIITGEDKVIQFFNKSAEKMFEYNRSALIGKNVKMLMPDAFAKNHDKYVENYMNTGVAKVIGSGRKVEAVTAKGLVFPIWLSVSETKWSGKKAFIATIQDLRADSTIEHTLNALDM